MKLHRRATFGEVSIQTHHIEPTANPRQSKAGMAPAINYPTPGVGALPVRRTSKGGARNSADRVSHELKSAQVGNLIAAERHARKVDLPFTRMMTIHWESAGVPLSAMVKATGRFLDMLTKALARKGYGTAWVWVHENGENKGGHCHILIHVPHEFVSALTGHQRRWLRGITGHPYKRRVIFSSPIGGRLGLEIANPELYRVNVATALGYLLKGASPDAAAKYHLNRLEAGGRVIGKRCGTSQNIGRKARQSKLVGKIKHALCNTSPRSSKRSANVRKRVPGNLMTFANDVSLAPIFHALELPSQAPDACRSNGGSVRIERVETYAGVTP